ncbi:MAG: tetratricopeptide (TPR) repeat protein [Parvicella sp.]|jgi:tetratricopeptide (TPR) repeat protein
MVMTFKGFVLICLLAPSLVSAQNKDLDSLFGVLNAVKDLDQKSLVFSEIAKFYGSSNADSAIYYANKGYRLAKQRNYDLGIAENVATLGDSYIAKDQLEEAKLYYTESLEYFDLETNLFDHTQISMIIGNINLAQNKYIEALELYQSCLDISKENNFKPLLPHLYNNLGNLYLQIEDYEDAQNNYLEAQSLFKEMGDAYTAAIVLSNISNIKNILGNSEDAISGYLDVIRVFSINENWADIARAYNLISQIYFGQEEYEKSQEYLELALNMLKNTKSDYDGPLSIYQADIFTTAAKLSFKNDRFEEAKKYAWNGLKLASANSYKETIYENARILSLIYDKTGQIDSALVYTKIYIKNNEEFQSENDLKRITQLKMQYEFDEILSAREIDKFSREAAYKRKELIFIGISIFTILAVVIMVLLYINQKGKTLKATLRHENLELEKEKLSRDIDYKKKELASNMMYLIEKNEFITSIARKLVEIKPAAKRDNQHLLQQIINELKLNSSSKIWEEFEMRFKEVHSEFYESLNEAFPDLTPNEVKICAFLRLNMSSKEISSITHQSVKSINMARFRLRKKINMDREENLIAFLTNL